MSEGRTTLFLPGQLIGDRYQVERLLGRGGVGSVVAATDVRTGRRVALKLLRSHAAGNPVAVERFRREALVLRSIRHPGVVAVEDAGALDDGTLFLALELLEGRTLLGLIRDEGPVDAPRLSCILGGLAGALEAIHAAGVLHRDVKPANIFLPRGEGSTAVKLVDFGLAKISGMSGLTRTGTTVGTVRYMSPEQLTTPADLDRRVDVYATGVVLYEALTARPAFVGTPERHPYEAILAGDFAPLREVAPRLGIPLTAVVERAMALERGDRYPTAAALAGAFGAALPYWKP